ncbi:hypothetical protein GCM10027614_81240 [Micromonospora vulcania]
MTRERSLPRPGTSSTTAAPLSTRGRELEGLTMNRSSKTLGVAAVVLAVLGLTPTVGHAAPGPPPTTPAAAPGRDMDPGMVAAMRRDLHLTDAQIDRRVRVEAAAPAVERRLRERLGTAFAGAWIPPGGNRLTVAVTDTSALHVVRVEGADGTVVSHSERQLNATLTALDRRGATAGRSVHGWYVDVPTNRVVVTVRPGGEQAARSFARDSGVAADAVTVVETPKLPGRCTTSVAATSTSSTATRSAPSASRLSAGSSAPDTAAAPAARRSATTTSHRAASPARPSPETTTRGSAPTPRGPHSRGSTTTPAAT